jgi:uncharacterized protein
MQNIIGRYSEIKVLDEALKSKEAELIALFGRRRVGKTFLIRNHFKNNIIFEFSGINNGSLNEHLFEFNKALLQFKKSKAKPTQPESWMHAFDQLRTYTNSIKSKNKKVIFLDEMPWLDSPKSRFMIAFDNFWNNYASKRNDIVVIICGSAASWMINKVLKNKGGLHNRVTKRIALKPFNLLETEEFLKSRKVILDRFQITQLYMVMGGIPFYLKEILPNDSAIKAIDRICFNKKGLLNTEFENLYLALFNNASKHTAIINALASKPSGLQRTQLLSLAKLPSGGTISKIIDELLESGFISYHYQYGDKKREGNYRLTDEYSLFYLKFISNEINNNNLKYNKISSSNSFKTWCGYAFEGICIKHVEAIKIALGIANVDTEISTWYYSNKKEGAQIDLIIDRNDRCINICEIKFTDKIFTITKSYADNLLKKKQLFHNYSSNTNTIFTTLISASGTKENNYSNSLLNDSLTLNSLFEPIEI